MKTFTLTDILKLIPFDPAYRTELSQRIVYGDLSERYDIEKNLWDAFWEMYEVLSDLKYKQMYEQVSKDTKTEELPGLMRKARQSVWQDFEDTLTGKKQDVQQLDEIRNKLQSWVGTMPKDKAK